MGMEMKELEYVLVPLGLLVFVLYHVWLLYSIHRNPLGTVIGLNAHSRHQWVLCMMSDPLKNGVLAVQTLRNNIMASTLLGTTAITLSSLIGIFASSTGTGTSESEGMPMTYTATSIKQICITVCFLIAFLCNVQSIRYYAHVSFLITAPTLGLGDQSEHMEYIAKILNRGSHSWSLGLRAFYLSFPLFLWIYGPIPMFACCCFTSISFYFLDTTAKVTRDLHTNSFTKDTPTPHHPHCPYSPLPSPDLPADHHV
ncbi:hypothetical protein PIB30_009511 [Stylosanthes scabra]|uniref:Uncharacterized protein n=1 Tax=Stylosanthes scabra TaxID=79078 RepID=A0ABU6Y4Q2_9FABA|nr:hypothetical protein [Stylosanthes scabra]